MPGQAASPPQEIIGHGLTVGTFCMACAAIGYSWILYQVLSRNWYDLKPCHVLQANYICATVIALVWGISMVLSQKYHNQQILEVLSDHHSVSAVLSACL